MADYYKDLGVSKGASDKEIRQAYRKQARKYHPDLNPGDDTSEVKFKKITEAYDVLSNSENRADYDRYGDNWKYGERLRSNSGPGSGDGRHTRSTGSTGFDFNWFGDLDDLLGRSEGSFRRNSRPPTRTRLETAVEVTLEEAFEGTKRNINLSAGGNQRRIEVTIPPGVDTGSSIHVDLGPEYDVYLNITVAPHSGYLRKGSDLETEVELPFEEAILGGSVQVATLKGKVDLKVPENSQNGQRIRLAGRGMPKLNTPDSAGDLYVILRPTLPEDLTDEERDLVEQLRALRSEPGVN